MTSAPTRMPVAVIGAGAIGRMHVERLLGHPEVAPAAIADPTPAARDYAAGIGVPWFADHRELLDRTRPGAVIVATPNSTHAEVGIACIERRLPVLMEKPVADTVAQGQRLCDAAAAAGVPLLVGHQRRHNPILRHARKLLADGIVGKPVSVTAMATWLKPDSYFELAWRRQAGGGPVLINLIHDIDLLRFLIGEVDSVQAMASNAVRGYEVEDTAAVLMRFACGALATLAVSDAAVAPWNWDLAAGEAAHYAQLDVNSHYISGTEGSLALPRLEVWRYAGTRGWHEPLTCSRTPVHRGDPYVEQLRHLRAVAEGREAPVCSGADGLRTLQAALAVQEAVRSQRPVGV
ncbi:Gfo/Idh/MocA family protein [Variovorax sp. RA8]|uniref:Gfo/Idh/MocA family protein n=1 Tax=Variovorax sp. (strain JCM 16519 / RA8) TaxID=662548 RepID=UPI0013193062|nr:Gfo/Idh/MocA family oxidoreductase [Variovorax sp. RA8]VTU27309.1 1,5-anhydro-D-fructose reductase [Variovorax sp. RA8]